MKHYLVALLLVLPLLAWRPGGAQSAFPNVAGRWAGPSFPDLSGRGLELMLEQGDGNQVRGLVSMNLEGTRGPLTAWVDGKVESDGNLQLETWARRRELNPRYVLNLEFDVTKGFGEAVVDLCAVGERNLTVPPGNVTTLRLLRVKDVQPLDVPVGRAYRLDFTSRGKPVGVSMTLDVPDREKLSGTFKLAEGASMRGQSEGPCKIFVPRYDPGFLIATLYTTEFEGPPIPLVSMRIPALTVGETKAWTYVGGGATVSKPGQRGSLSTEGGTAAMITP